MASNRPSIPASGPRPDLGPPANPAPVLSPSQIKTWAEAAVAGARLDPLPNPAPSGQDSLRVDLEHAVAVARFLRDDPRLLLDYASNVTGVDWPDKVVQEKTKVTRTIEGLEREIEETVSRQIPGFLEAVYHLYSTQLKHGPLTLRLRTADRAAGVHLPSLTPVWRAAELQEREIYDLFGVVFDGHPDLRRLLMWEEFQDHPMRKDYAPPPDLEPARSPAP